MKLVCIKPNFDRFISHLDKSLTMPKIALKKQIMNTRTVQTLRKWRLLTFRSLKYAQLMPATNIRKNTTANIIWPFEKFIARKNKLRYETFNELVPKLIHHTF